MSEQKTSRVDHLCRSFVTPKPPGLLLFAPLDFPPVMRFFVLHTTSRVIGRSRDCSIHVEDDEVSRRHASIVLHGDRWILQDCDSANGVFVNGSRVQAHHLEGGDVIRIGANFFRFLTEGMADEDCEHAVHTEQMVAGPSLSGIIRHLEHAARGDLTLLITGETGTGKELAARYVHLSDRGDGPFVPVNCSALPEELVESELFGHLKGAFSGANQDNQGLICEASGGTLFLDEIGDLPFRSQAKLLRVLQDHRVRPVGGTRWTPVDLRVICATNQPLKDRALSGSFRKDLYARVAELVVLLPPLRDRVEDIPLLVQTFMERHGGAKQRVSVGAMERLCFGSWPLNIRQLKSAVRRAILLSDGVSLLLPEHFEDEDLEINEGGVPATAPLGPARAESPEAMQLQEALQHHRGDVNRVALDLGVSRSLVYRRAKKHGIKPALYRP